MGRMRYMGSKKTISKKKPKGRPSKYTDALAYSICETIATTELGIHTICKEKGMPSPSTVFKWLTEKKDFSDNYTRAKELQAEFLVEKIISIADDTSNDTTITDSGKMVANSEWINRSRLRVDSRKWIASKLFPKKYGDKIDITTKDGAIGKTSQIILPNGTTIEI